MPVSLDAKIKPAYTNLLSKNTVPALLDRTDADVKPASTEPAYLVCTRVLMWLSRLLPLSKHSWLLFMNLDVFVSAPPIQ